MLSSLCMGHFYLILYRRKKNQGTKGTAKFSQHHTDTKWCRMEA